MFASDPEAREVTEQLIRDAGFDPVYLGDLGQDGLPDAQVAWALDGRVLYGALLSGAPASGSISRFRQNPDGLFVADPREAPGRH